MDKENRENDNPIWAGQNVYIPKLVARGNPGKEITVKPQFTDPTDLIMFWRTGILADLPEIRKFINEIKPKVSEEVYIELMEEYHELINKRKEVVTEKSNRELKDLILSLSAKLEMVKDKLNEDENE